MAYFPNGSSGEVLEYEFCSDCRHDEDCVILAAHSLYNYAQCSDKGMRLVLDVILPETHKCGMFVPKDTA